MATATPTIDRSKKATETIRGLVLDCLEDRSLIGILTDQLKELGFERRAETVLHKDWLNQDMIKILHAIDGGVRKRAIDARGRSEYHVFNDPRPGPERYVVRNARRLLEDPEPSEILDALRKINLDSIEVIDPERMEADRAVRAKQVRDLLKRCNVPGVIVRVDRRTIDYWCRIGCHAYIDHEKEMDEIRSLTKAILLKAFPATEDYSPYPDDPPYSDWSLFMSAP